MAIETGAAFLLKMSDGATPPNYRVMAGLRTTQLSISSESVVVTNKDSGGWRELLSGAGVRQISISGSGVFTGSQAETALKTAALGGVVHDYEVSFEGGETMRGPFLITRLDYAGDYNAERTYTLNLESAGRVTAA